MSFTIILLSIPRRRWGFERIELLTGQIKFIEKKILERARQDRSFSLLKSIPGIGDILAFTILYEVGDINRFAHVYILDQSYHSFR